MKDKLYWVWAQNALGISSNVKSDEIISYFGNAESLYFAGEYEWRISGIFTPGQINKLKTTTLDEAKKIVSDCQRYRIKIITPDDADYPSMLFKLPNLPLVLYVRGNLDCLKNKISIAVVGAREASDIGARIARALSASLSRSGAIIV
ncbi:MAG: DNA-processing protein DprA, partial [Acutalibacteraceae bacterium]|nr:DNA-processing protein DprA [Acutalibacteraceae bacterium]